MRNSKPGPVRQQKMCSHQKAGDGSPSQTPAGPGCQRDGLRQMAADMI